MENQISEMLKRRGIMQVWDEKKITWNKRREEIVDLLRREEYGLLPMIHDKLCFKETVIDENFCAGKVKLSSVDITASFGEKSFTFPIYTAIPSESGRYPFFVHINFRSNIPDKYMPVEEICDNGFALVFFNYGDITADNGDFTSGLAGVLFENGERNQNDCGKIAMWAWGASRALDYAKTLDCLDMSRATVVGHSRLGKTALLAGVCDERFTCAISNDSGCSGAALSRGKGGETVKQITDVFPFWFCKNYYRYADNEASLPFDQHFLIAAMAPRSVYVASAKEDLHADPVSEFLSCAAADEVYKKLGLSGFVHGDEIPNAPEALAEGNIAYHIRKGTHYFSREDWQKFMSYLKK